MQIIVLETVGQLSMKATIAREENTHLMPLLSNVGTTFPGLYSTTMDL